MRTCIRHNEVSKFIAKSKGQRTGSSMSNPDRRRRCMLLSLLILLTCLTSPAFSHADTCSNTSIAAGMNYTVGLKEDGTVSAVGYNENGQLNVSSWTNIKAVAAGWYHTVGLKEDGTVVAVGNSRSGQLNVSSWTNIKAVAAGISHTVGLKEDGTVVAVGDN